MNYLYPLASLYPLPQFPVLVHVYLHLEVFWGDVAPSDVEAEAEAVSVKQKIQKQKQKQ